MEIIASIKSIENFELYVVLGLFLFTIWFIFNTIRYYRTKKRRNQQLHRFGNRGEWFARTTIGKYYDKDYFLKRNYYNRESRDIYVREHIEKFWNRKERKKRKKK